jgi:hypothetical protein
VWNENLFAPSSACFDFLGGHAARIAREIVEG